MNKEGRNFRFSTDFSLLEDKSLNGSCIHLICLAGEGSLVYNDTCFHISPNDLLVMAHPELISNLAAGPGFSIEFFSADASYLNSLLPPNNYGIGGSVSLYDDPVIPLSVHNAERIKKDFEHIRERIDDSSFMFYDGIISSLCLAMMYDIFEFHALYYGTRDTSDRASYIVREFIRLLSTGITRTERSVSYFADRLNVSMKYLSTTLKRSTGDSAMSYIDRATVPIVKKYLANDKLTLVQIAELMNFSSPSHFCRYCQNHLGMSPSQWRKNKMPKKRNK